MEGKKGFWDILSVIFTMLVPIVGGVFTWVYNVQQNEYNKLQDERNNIIKQQEIQISKIQALEKFLPYIKKDADSGQQEAAIAVIYLLVDCSRSF